MWTSSAEARAAVWLQAWDAQGIHRTGTEADTAGADWLAQAAQAMGATVTVETFMLSRLDPIDTYLELGNKRLDGVPVFDAPSNGPRGVLGKLGPIGSGADLEVVELSPFAAYSDVYRSSRRTGRHKGLIIVCKGNDPGLALLNAEGFREPYGASAIHLSSEDRNAVAPALARKITARMVAHSTRTDVEARNVVVTLPGRSKYFAPLVVVTPRSSWWQSTSERGGGLVCWLETLHALLAEPPDCPVVLTANTGHELGHLGLDDFVARRPGWDQPGGATWIHYGANIGATLGKLSILSTSGDLRTAMAAALEESGRAADIIAPVTQVPNGETRDIHRAGGRYVSLVGTNDLFHLPQDRWPHAVDVKAIARIAAGAAKLVVALTRRADGHG